jgi:hypothetical protein
MIRQDGQSSLALPGPRQAFVVELSAPVGEVAWCWLPFSRWGVEYAWRDRASMLPPGCGLGGSMRYCVMVSQNVREL